MNPLLEVERLSVEPALQEVSLRLVAGETVALLGANGAGKSTLLRAIIGLARESSGTIRLEGQTIGHLAPEGRARLGIGYVPEGRRVFAGMTVQDNLLVACHDPRPVREARLTRVHRLFPVLRQRAGTPAWQLSGGQQQMLAIGRALMLGPRLLLLDEPSQGLAPIVASEVLGLIGEIAKEGVAVLLAEQKVGSALGQCGRVYGLKLGRIVLEGTPSFFADNRDINRLLF